jgi:anti-sigma B factor antagonist
MPRANGTCDDRRMNRRPVHADAGQSPDRLEIRTAERPGGRELRLRGELTIATLREFAQALQQVENSGSTLLVVDVRSVRFMDSTALAELVAAHKRSRFAGRRLLVVIAPGPIARLLEITGLDAEFETASTLP